MKSSQLKTFLKVSDIEIQGRLVDGNIITLRYYPDGSVKAQLYSTRAYRTIKTWIGEDINKCKYVAEINELNNKLSLINLSHYLSTIKELTYDYCYSI